MNRREAKAVASGFPAIPTTSARREPIPEGERFYFLEEWYPKYGNLVPRDIATRAIHRIVYQERLGLHGKPAVYLDVTHIPRETLDRKLEGILEIYEKFLGVDPHVEPMQVFPAMHYTMGGIWVNGQDQATNVPEFTRPGSANISITAPIASALIHWSPVFLAAASLGRPR